MANQYLETLKKTQAILMQMHRLLMASEKSEMEARTGKEINPSEWMHIMISDHQYAWLKPMLTLISDIDALMDNYTVSEKELQIIRQDSEILFLNSDGSNSDFYDHYKQVVQKNPDVIMYHGQLRNSILSLPAHSSKIEDTAKIRRDWHVRPKSFH